MLCATAGLLYAYVERRLGSWPALFAAAPGPLPRPRLRGAAVAVRDHLRRADDVRPRRDPGARPALAARRPRRLHLPRASGSASPASACPSSPPGSSPSCSGRARALARARLRLARAARPLRRLVLGWGHDAESPPRLPQPPRLAGLRGQPGRRRRRLADRPRHRSGPQVDTCHGAGSRWSSSSPRSPTGGGSAQTAARPQPCGRSSRSRRRTGSSRRSTPSAAANRRPAATSTPGRVFVLMILACLLNGARPRRSWLIAGAVAAVLAIGPNIVVLHEASKMYKREAVITRSDTAALEIARRSVDPGFQLNPEIPGPGRWSTSSPASTWKRSKNSVRRPTRRRNWKRRRRKAGSRPTSCSPPRCRSPPKASPAAYGRDDGKDCVEAGAGTDEEVELSPGVDPDRGPACRRGCRAGAAAVRRPRRIPGAPAVRSGRTRPRS